MLRLENKVVIITGGGQGIGKATARRFAEEGAKLAIVDVNEQAGKAVADELSEQAEAVFLKVDVSKRNQAQQLAQAVHDHFGRIDVLINNAGILRDAQLLKMTEEQFDAVIAVNLKGAFNCTQAVAPFMVEQGSGRIVNASSVVGLYGNFGQSNYVASKAGLIGMTKVWARELGRKGICVNAVAPGFIGTEMVQAMPEKIIAGMVEKVPLKRMGTPEEVANVYVFLASDEASYINGAVISVDGGVVV
ncbi:MAG TPA: 3-oxoacyl-ACP reductase FabG [Candidatus Bipolaricaulota bacterium]